MMYLMADLGRQNRHLRIHIFEICTPELTFNACKLIAHVSRKRHHLLLFEVLARIWQQIWHNIDQTIQTGFRGAESSEAFISASKKLQLNAHILVFTCSAFTNSCTFNKEEYFQRLFSANRYSEIRGLFFFIYSYIEYLSCRIFHDSLNSSELL